jgi:hypothetical protein
MNNKKGLGGIVIIGIFLLIMITIYLILFIPIPAFKSLRTLINYILIVMLFVVIQVLFILGYYYIVKYAIKGFNIYKSQIQKTILDFKVSLINRGR